MADDLHPLTLNRRQLLRAAAAGAVTVGVGATLSATFTGTAHAGGSPAAIAVQPSQPCGFAYSVPISPASMSAYAQPGALVAVSQYQMPNSQFLADGGCCVLIYDDQLYPGPPLTGTALEDHLESLVEQWPWGGGFFADELGSQNAYGIDYDTCVAVAQGFRNVADRHGMIVIHNGVWERTDNGGLGGYPNKLKNGCILADGTCIEDHEYAQFWQDYLDGPQWIHPGLAMVIVTDDSQRGPYIGHASHIVTQIVYDIPPAPWGPFTDTGLPTHST